MNTVDGASGTAWLYESSPRPIDLVTHVNNVAQLATTHVLLNIDTFEVAKFIIALDIFWVVSL